MGTTVICSIARRTRRLGAWRWHHTSSAPWNSARKPCRAVVRHALTCLRGSRGLAATRRPRWAAEWVPVRSRLSEPRREERCSVVTERSAAVHSVPGSDRTCRANTVAGERCRRLSTADGLCAFHLRRQRESTVLDPLEIAAWDKEVAVLRVIDAGFLSGEPDAGSGRAGRAVP